MGSMPRTAAGAPAIQAFSANALVRGQIRAAGAVGFVRALGAPAADAAGVAGLRNQRALGAQQGRLALAQQRGGRHALRRNVAGLVIGGEKRHLFRVYAFDRAATGAPCRVTLTA